MSSSDHPEPPSDSPETGPDLPPYPQEGPPSLPPEEHPGPARPLPLARLILGAILLAGGVLWLLGVTNVADVSPLPALAGALIVVGLALVAGSRTGGHSGLIALGVVLTVVTRAISTIIVNRRGEMMPRSSPAFNTISSINPRVFIKAPKTPASRHESPERRAATIVPPNFPTVATRMIAPQTSQSCQSPSSVISVRRPV